MGRGRAKAKQTKVARDLKYRTHETDFGALARELHGDSSGEAPGDTSGDTDTPEVDDEYDVDDGYGKWGDYVEPGSRD